MRTEHYIVVANTEISVQVPYDVFKNTIEHATENMITLLQHEEHYFDDDGEHKRITLYGAPNDDAIN